MAANVASGKTPAQIGKGAAVDSAPPDAVPFAPPSEHTRGASRAVSAAIGTLGTDDKATLAKSFFESRYKGGTVRKNVMAVFEAGTGAGEDTGMPARTTPAGATQGENGADEVRRSATAKMAVVRPKSGAGTGVGVATAGGGTKAVRNSGMKTRTLSGDLFENPAGQAQAQAQVGEDAQDSAADGAGGEHGKDGSSQPARRSWYSHYRTGSRADRDSLVVANLSSDLPGDASGAGASADGLHSPEPSTAGTATVTGSADGLSSRMVSVHSHSHSHAHAHARGGSRAGTLRTEGSVIYNYSDLWFEQIAATLAGTDGGGDAASPSSSLSQSSGSGASGAPPGPATATTTSDAKRAIGGIMAVEKWFVISPFEADAMARAGMDVRSSCRPTPDEPGKLLLDTAKIDQQELKRQEVIYETLVTEREYVRDLKIIIDLYLKVMREKKILPPKGLAIVFSNIEQILPVNVELLARLEDRRIRSGAVVKEVGDVFLELASYLKMYTVYCGNQPEAMAYLTGESANHELKLFFEYCSFRPETRNLTVGAFLLKPVQRICKYPLLLKELLKHTSEAHPDHTGVKAALDAIMKVVDVVNERRHIVENSIRTLKILGNLEYNEKQKLTYEVSRRHLLDATLAKLHYNPDTSPTGLVTRKGNARYVVVFSDCVIIAVPSQGWLVGGNGRAKVKAIYPIKDVLATEVVATADDGSFVFEMRTLRNGEEKTMYFSTPSKAERHRWMKTINNARIEALEGIESRNVASASVRRQSAVVSGSIESISSNENEDDVSTDGTIVRGRGVLKSAGSAMYLSLVSTDDAPTPVSIANEEFEDAIVADTLRSVAVTHVELVDGGLGLPSHLGEQCIIEEALSQELAPVDDFATGMEAEEGTLHSSLSLESSRGQTADGGLSSSTTKRHSVDGDGVSGHKATGRNSESVGSQSLLRPGQGRTAGDGVPVPLGQNDARTGGSGTEANESSSGTSKAPKHTPTKPALSGKIAALQANIAPAIGRNIQSRLAVTTNAGVPIGRPTADIASSKSRPTPSEPPLLVQRPATPDNSKTAKQNVTVTARPPSVVLATSIAAVKLRPVSSRPTSLLPGQLDLGASVIDKSKWLTATSAPEEDANTEGGTRSVSLIVDQFEQWRAKRPVSLQTAHPVQLGEPPVRKGD